jgi:hypothetical protein
MSAQRLKFQVWSEAHQSWRTAYCLPEKLHNSMILMKKFGIKFRVGGRGG